MTVNQLIGVLQEVPHGEMFVSIDIGDSSVNYIGEVLLKIVHRPATADSDLAATVAQYQPEIVLICKR